MSINSRKTIDHLLLLMTIAVSGFPFFSSTVLFIPLFIVLFTVFLLRKRKFDTVFVLAIIFLVFITAMQTVVFNFFSIQTSAGVFLRLINGYLIIKILRDNFANYYVNILFGLSLISLIFYIPIILLPGFDLFLIKIASFMDVLNIADSDADSLIIYTLHHLTLSRNTGPFWEAGAFGGYLVIAYIFNRFSKSKKKKTKEFLLLVTILTTFSSTAYFVIFFFIFAFYFRYIKNFFIKISFISLLTVMGYFVTFELPFLGNKVSTQVKDASQVNNPYLDSTNSQRFLSILRDYEDFKGHEFFGRGSNPITRYSYDPDNQIRTVGLTDILVRMGLPYFLFMIFLLHRSMKYFTSFYNFNGAIYYNSFLISIILTLMSQVYFNHPVFWSLLFLSCVYRK
tara:strand:- start:11976 stop:13163 length:1188 start_codon:yes stop_codon:yes gene_type:complete